MTSERRISPRWADPEKSALKPLELQEAVFEAPNGRRLRMVASSRDGIISMGSQMDAYFGHLRPAEPDEEPDEGALDEAIDVGIATLLNTLAGHDALDVMVMLRQFIIPPDFALWNESASTVLDSWAVAEVVALVLLGLGLPTRSPTCTVATASIIPGLVDEAASVVQLATIRGMIRATWRANTSASDDMSSLAWRLSGHETTVRGREYTQLADRINETVLRTPRTEAAFRKILGFTYDQVLAVREAIIELGGYSLGEALTQLERAVADGGPPSPEAADAIRSLFEAPSRLHLVTAERLAQQSGLDPAVVAAVLDIFSFRPDGRSSQELVQAFCEARNPLAGKAILHCPRRGYLPLPGAIASDEIRRTCEARLKETSAWTAYGRARDQAVEGLVTDIFDDMLQGRATIHRNLRYRHSKEGHDLSPGSSSSGIAPVTEADALVLVDGVAICIEVKAGGLRTRSRQGGVAQLQGDLAKTVQEAAEQADRLRSIIQLNGGLWLEGGTWLDLGDVREIHTVVACLDDLGPLALATSELVQTGVLPQTQLPWVVSVHDLLVFKEVLERPEHILTYIRRRTNRDAAMWITGTDELDILMWFVAGGFYFQPDPDRLFAMHPNSKPPTAKQRRLYSEQGRTHVGTFTDSLDAYFYFEDDISSRPAECPRRQSMEPRLQVVFDAMRVDGAPGWLRAAADIDGYSQEAQRRLALNIDATLRRSAPDGSFRTFTTGGFDDTGRWIFIFAAGADTVTNRERLSRYLQAKKHQERADRALGVFLAPTGIPRLTMWSTRPSQDDAELDGLVRAMGLIPPDRSPSVVPPRVKAARKKPRRRR